MRTRTAPLLVLALVALAIAPGTLVQADSQQATLSDQQRLTLGQYAADTWNSFVALTYPSGLPDDNISADGVRAGYTSPTNIGS